MLSYCLELAFAGHGNFVSSICLIAPHAHCEETLVATGCQDASIRLFSLSQKQPVNQLLGHTGNVSALRSGGSRGMIVSGSWDSSVKQWLQGNCVQTMNGKFSRASNLKNIHLYGIPRQNKLTNCLTSSC